MMIAIISGIIKRGGKSQDAVMGDINSNLRLICGSVEIEQAAAELVTTRPCWCSSETISHICSNDCWVTDISLQRLSLPLPLLLLLLLPPPLISTCKAERVWQRRLTPNISSHMRQSAHYDVGDWLKCALVRMLMLAGALQPLGRPTQAICWHNNRGGNLENKNIWMLLSNVIHLFGR